MNRSDMPSRAWTSLSSAMICACTVTSSAVVGSSAIKQIGLVGERHGDHDALALAAGQLMRIAAEPALRIGNADLARAPRWCAARAAAPVRPRCSSKISPICFSIVCSGLSEVIGSWNTMVMSSPRTRRMSRSGKPQQFAALEGDGARRMPRRRVGQQLEDRQRRHRFAGAGFADQRHGLALADVERDPIDGERLSPPRPMAEGDGKVADGEERVRSCQFPMQVRDARLRSALRSPFRQAVIRPSSADRNSRHAASNRRHDMNGVGQFHDASFHPVSLRLTCDNRRCRSEFLS